LEHCGNAIATPKTEEVKLTNLINIEPVLVVSINEYKK
jgi:hypothetical protein